MKELFNSLCQIERHEFLHSFQKHVENRVTIDATEKQIFRSLQNADNLNFYVGALNELGIGSVILPHHAVELEPGKAPDRPVKKGGDSFQNVIRHYDEIYGPNSRFSDCLVKIQRIQTYFFNNRDLPMNADFLFVCNQRALAHPGDDHYDASHGDRKLYIGNGFHRFVAYGLWIRKYGFRPLEVHYVEQRS
jgi:hypothetical protein